MSIQPVRLFTDLILKKPCKFITDFTGVDNIASDLIETMLEYKGVGLAANQIGVDKNITALHLEDKTKIIVVANIIITRYTKEVEVSNEGCLSCPGIWLPIKRYSGIEIECQGITGEKLEFQLTGYDARILQHEFDHICGRLITDTLMKL